MLGIGRMVPLLFVAWAAAAPAGMLSSEPPAQRRLLSAHGRSGPDYSMPATVGAEHVATDPHAGQTEDHGPVESSAADPQGSDGSHGGKDGGDDGGEHGAANDGEHSHGGGHQAPPIDDEMALLLMLSLILLSVIFEKTKHYLEHSVDEHKHIILQALFGELTVLGFIALLTFFLMNSGVFSNLSIKLYHDEQHLLHLFEKVHFGLFFVMVLFLLLIGWLIFVQNVAARRWHALDKEAQAFLQEQRAKKRDVEKRRRALEMEATAEATADARRRAMEAGGDRMAAVDDGAPVKPPSIPPPSDKYLQSRYGQGGSVPIGLGVRSGYTRQIDLGPALDIDDTSADWQLRKDNPALFRFLQVRARFVYGFQGAEGRKVKLNDPNDTFNFGAYLTQCSAAITAEVVEVHPITWILVAASLALVYVCNTLLSKLGMSIVLVCWGWICVLVMQAILRDLARIENSLAPPTTASLHQIQTGDEDALPPYMLHPISRGCNKHEALFPFRLREEGPEWFCHILRTVLLTCAVYVIGLQSVFAKDMLDEDVFGKGMGIVMLIISILSVFVVLAQLLSVFPLLVMTQSIGMMKKPHLVEKTFRQQKLDLSLRLLKLLTSMQSHTRQMRKLKCKAAVSANGGVQDMQKEQEEVRREQERALAILDRNPTQKKELEAAFRLFDTSGDGNIEASELKGLLQSMGQNVSNAEVTQLLNEMDADNSGSVSLEEFLTVMASEVDENAEEAPTIQKLADDMFAILDADESGVVSFKEFRHELQKLPTGMSDEEIDELLQEMFGGGGDSQIDKHEFMHFVASHKDELGLA